jgi:tRNA pseudouridine32 synthase/23S rRNA pseudouridine746 synthase
MDLRILVEDDALVAIDKPPGALSVPSRTGRDDSRPCALYALSSRYGGRQVFPVHRLDEDVSGILVFARTPAAQRELSALFEARTARKRYEALVEDRADPGPGARAFEAGEVEWESRLLRGKKRAYESPHGKLATTRARCEGAVSPSILGPAAAGLDGARLLRFALEPLTGRSHQLRVHLASHGLPIVGDALYGARAAFPPGGIALRAVRLELAGRVFEAPPLDSLLSAARPAT